MFYIYFSALFPNIKWNEIVLNGYIIIEHIMESTSHKSINVNTIINSRTTSHHTQNREQTLLFKKFKVYYLL